jgi:hypothetical protein
VQEFSPAGFPHPGIVIRAMAASVTATPSLLQVVMLGEYNIPRFIIIEVEAFSEFLVHACV